MTTRYRKSKNQTRRKQKYNSTKKRGGYVWDTKPKTNGKKSKTTSIKYKSTDKKLKSATPSIFPNVIN